MLEWEKKRLLEEGKNVIHTPPDRLPRPPGQPNGSTTDLGFKLAFSEVDPGLYPAFAVAFFFFYLLIYF